MRPRKYSSPICLNGLNRREISGVSRPARGSRPERTRFFGKPPESGPDEKSEQLRNGGVWQRVGTNKDGTIAKPFHHKVAYNGAKRDGGDSLHII